VAGVGLAAHQKKARRHDASLVLIDESGLLMGPRLRRTWAPRGQTPALVQRGAHRQKVSVIAALGLSPRRDRLRLDCLTLADAYFDNWSVASFLEAMLRGLGGRFVVVWDGGNMHKGNPIRDLEARFSGRLVLERLPPFAPRLNPVEVLWRWLKWQRLSNFAARDVQELENRVLAELSSIQEDQAFLRNLFHASELPLPRTLLS
jgi:transposase